MIGRHIAQVTLGSCVLVIAVCAFISKFSDNHILEAPWDALRPYQYNPTGMAPNTAIALALLAIAVILTALKGPDKG